MNTQNTSPLARRLLSLMATSAALTLLPAQLAAQSTWSGGGADANWSTSANWSAPLSDSFSTALTFGGSTRLTNTNDLTGGTASSITFSSGSGAFVIGGNALTLGGNITNSSTSLQTLNNDLSTTAVSTVTLTTGGGNVTLGGIISGTGGGLTTAGAGTLTLNGANTYTGATTIGAGTTVKVGNTSALGATSGSLTMAAGSSLDLNGFNVTKGNFSATTATATVTSASAATLTITPQSTNNLYAGLSLTGAASLMLNGGGGTTQPLGTGSTITGTGSLGFQNQTNVIRVNSLATNLGTNGTLLLNGSGMIQNSSTVTLGANNAIVINGSGNAWNYQQNGAIGLTINGTITGSGTLNTTQGFSAAVVVAGDMTGFSGTWNLQNAGTAASTSNNSTQLRFSNTSASVAGSSSMVLTQSATTSGNVNGTNTVQWLGSGNRTIAIGDLTTTASGVTGFTDTQIFLQNGTNNTTATYEVGAVGNNSTYSGTIRNGTGTAQIVAIKKVGTGTWTLTGTNTYTGGTAINAGALELGSAAAISTSSGAITFGGGTLKYGTGITTDYSARIAAGTSASAIKIDTGANNVVFGTALTSSQSGGLTKSGSGSLTFNSANAYTGATTISGGSLVLGAAQTLSGNLVLGAGTLDAGTFGSTFGGLDLNGAGSITLGSGASLIFSDSSAIDWTGGSLSISGSFVGGSSIRFGTNSSALSGTQLSMISVNSITGWQLDSSGFLVSAIPEPASFAALAGLGALGLTASRRRRR